MRSPRYTKKHDLDKISCPTIIKFRLHMKVKKSYIRNIMNYMYIVLNRQQLDNSRYLNNVCITFFSQQKSNQTTSTSSSMTSRTTKSTTSTRFTKPTTSSSTRSTHTRKGVYLSHGKDLTT